MPNVYTAHVCCLKTTTVKDGFHAQMSNGAHTVPPVGKGLLYVAGARNDRHLFTVAAKC